MSNTIKSNEQENEQERKMQMNKALSNDMQAVDTSAGNSESGTDTANTGTATANTGIMIVGVGGQGTLLASRILGALSVKAGYDVKVSEVHGMSQRGGSVVTYVRIGCNVNSPVIEEGEADIILAFEQLEAIRWIKFLKSDGLLIMNNQKINPMPVIIGRMKYPEGIEEELGKYTRNIVSADALGKAEKSGSKKAVNVVLLGILSNYMKFEKQEWLDCIRETVPGKLLDINIKAFEEGCLLGGGK